MIKKTDKIDSESKSFKPSNEDKKNGKKNISSDISELFRGSIKDIGSQFISIASPKNKFKIRDFGYFIEPSELNIDRENIEKLLLSFVNSEYRSSTILIGPSGCGKTSLVQSISGKLKRKIFCLNWDSLISHTSFRGQFEEKLSFILKKAIEENFIIFIDEIHIVTVYKDFAVSDLIKPYLNTNNNRLTIIGATTNSEYRLIQNDTAFDRRFNKMFIPILSTEELLMIVRKYMQRDEKQYDIKYENGIDSYLVNHVQFNSDETVKVDRLISLFMQIHTYLKENSDTAATLEKILEIKRNEELIKEYEEAKNELLRSDILEENSETKLRAIKKSMDEVVYLNKLLLKDYRQIEVDRMLVDYIIDLNHRVESQIWESTEVYHNLQLLFKMPMEEKKSFSVQEQEIFNILCYNQHSAKNKSHIIVPISAMLGNDELNEKSILQHIGLINGTLEKICNKFGVTYSHNMLSYEEFMSQHQLNIQRENFSPHIKNGYTSYLLPIFKPNMFIITAYESYFNKLSESSEYSIFFSYQSEKWFRENTSNVTIIPFTMIISHKQIMEYIQEQIVDALKVFHFLNIKQCFLSNIIKKTYIETQNISTTIQRIACNIIAQINFSINFVGDNIQYVNIYDSKDDKIVIENCQDLPL